MQAHVSRDVLREMLDSMQSCASSVASIHGRMESFIRQHMDEAKKILETLRREENEARREEQLASDIYYECIRRRRYNAETDQYEPTCDCEERDWHEAEDKRYKIQQRRERAEYYIGQMELEVNYFNSPNGGGGLMSTIQSDYAPNATNRLIALQEKVERYETLEAAGVDIGDSTSSTPRLADAPPTASRFRAGTRRVREAGGERGPQVCPYCSPRPCTCGMEERQRIMMSRFRNNGR